ncbi:MAG: amidohydrolase [Deltaproteobacteria bacterium]|nr:amidohydrolase [Deltaproteobacteria bacterium]
MIIDFHTHVFPAFFRKDRTRFFSDEPAFKLLYASSKSKLTGARSLIDHMDAEGVHRSVIFGFPWRKTDHFRRHNDYILDMMQKFPDRLIGFCCFDPLSRDAAGETERCLKAGLKGIGELAVYDSDFSAPIISGFDESMGIAYHYEVPVLVHCNEPVGHQYPGKTAMTLRQLYQFLKTFPKNNIVLAHWGGGLMFYALMKKEVQDTLKNVWFDTAASPFLYQPKIYRIAEDMIGPDKILFGSDYPLINPSRYFQDIDAVAPSPESIARIKGGNAAHLLGLNS